jgi:galactonate dehydratase
MHASAAVRRGRLGQSWALQSPATADPLAITNLETFRLRSPGSGRSWSVLKVETQTAGTGFGEAAHIDPAEVVRAKSNLTGQPATRYEFLRHAVAGTPSLSGPLDMALLDLTGRRAKAPVYQLLGGPTRHKVRLMAALAGGSDTALLEEMKAALGAGHRVFSVPLPARDFPNPRAQFVQRVRERLDRLRAAAGEDADFVLDCAGQLTPAEAANVSAALEKFHPLWLDNACPLSNMEAVAKLSRENVTPLGWGRGIATGGGFQDLLRNQVIDVLRTDIGVHGIGGIRKLAALAETYYTAVAPYHGCGPISTLAGLQLAASLPNFFLLEAPVPKDTRDAAMFREILGGHALEVKDGFAMLPPGAGLGAQVNEMALDRFKEVRA